MCCRPEACHSPWCIHSRVSMHTFMYTHACTHNTHSNTYIHTRAHTHALHCHTCSESCGICCRRCFSGSICSQKWWYFDHWELYSACKVALQKEAVEMSEDRGGLNFTFITTRHHWSLRVNHNSQKLHCKNVVMVGPNHDHFQHVLSTIWSCKQLKTWEELFLQRKDGPADPKACFCPISPQAQLAAPHYLLAYSTCYCLSCNTFLWLAQTTKTFQHINVSREHFCT